MTITAINQQPAAFSPAYNENIYLVSSSATAQANFRYIFDVYETNGSTLIARVKLPCRPGDSRGLFDAKRIIENYLSYNLPSANEDAGFYQNTNSFYKYTVKIGEEYDVVDTLTLFPAQQTISGKYIWNAALDWLDFREFEHTDYLLITGATKSLLTHAPAAQRIEAAQNAWLYMMTNTDDSVVTGRFRKYDKNGTLLGTLDIASAHNPISDDNDRFLRLACGVANIEAHTAGWIDSNVSYYTVQVLDLNLDAICAMYQFNIVDNCRFDTVRLHWLNKLGGWDSFNFTLKSSESLAVTRQLYRQRYGLTTGTSWSYEPHERGDTVFESRARQTFKINSDWISEVESVWLEELLTSPEVYVELDASTLVAVALKTTAYEKKKKQNQKLFNLALEYEYSFEKIRQRG